MKKLLILFCLILFLNSYAEIVVEYKVTAFNEGLIADASNVMAQKMTVIISDSTIRINYVGGPNNGSEFHLFELGEDYFYNCLNLPGTKKAFKIDRPKYSLLSTSDTTFSVNGASCKKALAELNGRNVVIYYTDSYGVGFFPMDNIPGIPLLWVEEHSDFEKVVFDAVSIKIVNISDVIYNIDDYEIVSLESAPRNELLNKKISNIKVKNIEGDKTQINFIGDKITVLNFWFKNCKPCIQEMPELNLMIDSLSTDHINFIALSLDSYKEVKKFLSKRDFNYQHYTSAAPIANKFNVSSYPTHIIIDQNGKVVYQNSGFGKHSISTLFFEIRKQLEKAENN